MLAVALKGLIAAGFLALAVTGSHAVEKFIPQGHLYTPDNQPLPPLNSPSDYINNRTDIYQTEIYRKEYDRKIFDQEFFRYDLAPGPYSGPRY